MADKPLVQLSPKELDFLRKALKKGQIPAPVTKLALESIGKGAMFERLGAIDGAPKDAALALIELSLSAPSVQSSDTPAPTNMAELVWTTPEVPNTKARRTTALLLELLGSAREEVLIAGYEFDHGAGLFEPLHKVMKEHGVPVRLLLDIRSAPSPKTPVAAHLALHAHRFMEKNWPFGSPTPSLYYYAAAVKHRSYKSMHAKCVVVDRKRVLIGSANFTKRGHTRNLEVGVCLHDDALASTLLNQFDRLVDTEDLIALPMAAEPGPLLPEEVEQEEGLGAPGSSPYEPLADELLVSDDVRALFLSILDSGLPAPVVGEDVESEAGAILGSPELAWPELRVAVLLPEQQASRKSLEAADWSCFSAPLGDESFDALCELIGREV